MKDLIITPLEIKQLDDLLSATSYLIGNEKFAVRLAKSMSLDEIKEFRVKTKILNKNLYINVNKIFLEDELNELEQYLKYLKEINIDGIFYSDMAVYMIGVKLGLVDKLVYYSETQMVNYIDCQHFLDLNIKGVILSKEMTLEDILITSSKVKGNIGVLIHGYYHMFYSKRKLLRNFHQKYDLVQDYHQNYNLKLKELTRNDYYPIYEDANGTNIFSSACLSTIPHFQSLITSNINMLIIDGIFLTKEHLNKALTYYFELLNGKKENYQLLLEQEFSQVRFSDGFLFNKIGIYK